MDLRLLFQVKVQILLWDIKAKPIFGDLSFWLKFELETKGTLVSKENTNIYVFGSSLLHGWAKVSEICLKHVPPLFFSKKLS